MGTHADSSTTQTLHMYIIMTKATNQQWFTERWQKHSKQVDVGKGEEGTWKWNGKKQQTGSVESPECVYTSMYVCGCVCVCVCVCLKTKIPTRS